MANNEMNKIFALLVGECWHESSPVFSDGIDCEQLPYWKCAKCGKVAPNNLLPYSAIVSNELSPDFRRRFAEKWPVLWTDYQVWVYEHYMKSDGIQYQGFYIDRILSPTNLYTYLKANGKEFEEECEYQKYCSSDPQAPDYCPTRKWRDGDCTGRIPKKGCEEIIKLLKEAKDEVQKETSSD